MKIYIQKELKKYKMIEPLSHLIILYADIKHPHSIIFNQSKYKRIVNKYNMFPFHLLTPIPQKKRLKFELIMHDSEKKQTILYI